MKSEHFTQAIGLGDFSLRIAIFNHKAYLEEIHKHTHTAIDKWVHTAIYGKPRSTSRRAWRKWRRRMYSQECRATAWMDLQEEAVKIQG